MKKRARLPKTQPPATESDLEAEFLRMTFNYRLPTPTLQHIFHPTRNWRFDFCWPLQKVAVEIQGFGPGHNSLVGMTNDYAKHNQALLLNWKIIYLMAKDLKLENHHQTINLVKTMLGL